MVARAQGSTRGPFIAVEGLDGAGTTTQVALISAYLRALGFPTWTTREPSGGPLGTVMRAAIEGRESLTPQALALGFAADRLHHMFRPGGINSMLADGVWVISDRYVLSSLAYQATQSVELDWLIEINRFAPEPDVTVFIDTPLSLCLERISSRGENIEDMFHRRSSLIATRRHYMHAIAKGEFVGKLVTADGSSSKQNVLHQIVLGMTEELQTDFGLLALVPPGSSS